MTNTAVEATIAQYYYLEGLRTRADKARAELEASIETLTPDEFREYVSQTYDSAGQGA